MIILFSLLLIQFDNIYSIFPNILSEVKITPQEIKIDIGETFYFSKTYNILNITRVFLESPLKLPLWSMELSNTIQKEVKFSKILSTAQALSDYIIRLDIQGDPSGGIFESSKSNKFDEFVVFKPDKYKKIGDDTRKRLEQNITFWFKCYEEASKFKKESLSKTDAKILNEIIKKAQKSPNNDIDNFLFSQKDEIDKIDLYMLQGGGFLLALCAELFIENFKNFSPQITEPIFLDSKFGEIIIGSNLSDIIPVSYYTFLVVDFSGDDMYRFVPSSVTVTDKTDLFIFDFSGNDLYQAQESIPSFGGGVVGYSFIFDIRGNDEYKCKAICEGAGFFGVGILADFSGDDTYSSLAFSQGSGLYGSGILADYIGNDRYETYIASQGYGLYKASGLLVDFQGDDKYEANDKDIRFPAFQDKKHNTSQSQGCGFGLRGDYKVGYSQSGGFGGLLDFSGNDSYSAGVFGQGCGYWYGTGILYDGKGNDKYSGYWYCQGTAAHFAVGFIQDNEGDDSYNCVYQGQGHGHDFSIGFLYDKSGNDSYSCDSRCIGSAHANGVGIFIDEKGMDNYTSKEMSIGFATTSIYGKKFLREVIKTLGIFLDVEGEDTYTYPLTNIGNGKIWTQEGKEGRIFEKGVGIDTSVVY